MEIFAILSSTQSCIWYSLLRRKSKTGMRKQNILQLYQALYSWGNCIFTGKTKIILVHRSIFICPGLRDGKNKVKDKPKRHVHV